MIVVDASVLTDALAYSDPRGSAARRALTADPVWTAPAHVVAETFSALRGLDLGAVPGPTAEAVVRRLERSAVDLVPTSELLDAMWAWRHRLGGYDAAYVALAARRDIPLVTADARLAAGAEGLCRVDLVRPG